MLLETFRTSKEEDMLISRLPEESATLLKAMIDVPSQDAMNQVLQNTPITSYVDEYFM